MTSTNLKNIFIITFFLLGLTVHASAFKLPTVPGLSGGDTAGFDLGSGKTELVDQFFASSTNYLNALALLNKALGKNVEAAQIEKAIEYANDPGIDEADRMKNSIKTSNEASKSIEADLNNQGTVITAEGQVFYAQSLPPAAKGLIGTLKMIPITKNMVNGIKANPISAISQVGGLAKVIPNLPSYIQTIQKTMKLIQSRAKAEGIDGADDPALDSAEDDFDL